MATEPEDDEEVVTPDPDVNDEAGDEAPPEDDGEVDVSFGDEPKPEEGGEESSVIRGLRQQLREATKRASALEKVAPQQQIAEPGPEPLWEKDEDGEKYEWDQNKFLTEWRGWKQRKDAYDSAVSHAQQVEQQRVDAYNAQKATVKIPDIEAAEKRVFGELDEIAKNALIRAKSPALVAALDRHPEKLAAIAAIKDPVEMVLMLGELRGKMQIMPKRRAPEPEEIARGTASNQGNADKALEKLEKEAEKTGDRSKIAAYRYAKRSAA